MICTLSRWCISRHHDTGRKIPGIFQKHAKGCVVCRRFQEISEDLTETAPSFKRAFQESRPEFFENIPEREWSRKFQGPEVRRRRFGLLHAAVTGLAVALIAVGIFILQPFHTTHRDRVSPLNYVGTFLKKASSFDNMASNLDMPVEREFDSLGKKLRTVSSFVLSCLDMKIEN